MSNKKVCICGGGNLGHVVTGFLAARGEAQVSLLTRHPERWQQQLEISTPEGKVLQGAIQQISSNPAEVIPAADIVLLCLPGFSIREELLKISPYLQPNTAVGSIVSSTGFFFEAMEVLPATTPLFGFQRVPFIARTTAYGRSAALLGYKPMLHVAIEQTTEKEVLRTLIERLFATPTVLLQSYYEVSLTNSNPILHPSRLYAMWKDWHEGIVYPEQSLFREFFFLLSVLPVSKGSIPTILDYYESTDAASLTRKLQSIEAFKGILSPMRQVEGGYVPDFASRYFTEDFPYGLRIIQQQAQKHHIPTPIIDRILAWGLKNMNSEME